MNISNSYTLLSQFLRPAQDYGADPNLLRIIRSNEIDWTALLHQANQQLVTPLWYLNLRRDGLLEYLPNDLADYLGELHAANRDRNRLFTEALTEVLDVCQREDLSPLLLKGAAAFADDLYSDLGARMQIDLDLLLPPDQATLLSARLLTSGYQVVESEEDLTDNTAPTAHHHHLKALNKPGTPVVVEIHYRVVRGKPGEAFKEALTVPTIVAGIECRMFAPEWRDLHNIMHAMVSDRGTIHSLVPLKAAAESAWLMHKYPEADFQKIAEVVKVCGYEQDYLLYRSVSEKLGLLPDDYDLPGDISRLRVDSCLKHGGCLIQEQTPVSLALYLSFYRRLSFPRWAWDYICYLDGAASTWQRLKKMGSYVLRPGRWKKI